MEKMLIEMLKALIPEENLLKLQELATKENAQRVIDLIEDYQRHKEELEQSLIDANLTLDKIQSRLDDLERKIK